MVSTLSHCANIPDFIALWSRQQERDTIAEYVLNVPQKVMLITHPLSSGQGLAVPFGRPSLIFQNDVMKPSILYTACNFAAGSEGYTVNVGAEC